MFHERVPRVAALGGMLTLLAVAPAFAQATYPEEGRYRERGPLLYVNGGGFSALTDVTREGLDFGTGYSLGGGLGYQINRYLAIRASFNYARAELETSSGTPAPDPYRLEGRDFSKYFYGGDLQIRYPGRTGWAPYLLLGGGAVTVDMPSDTRVKDFTKPAGKVGAGLGYTFPGSGASVFAEYDGWVYKWDNNSLLDPTVVNRDRTQWDSTWSAGVRYVF
jgi:opacity protein-like surface antigen